MRILAYKAVLLSTVFLAYFVAVAQKYGHSLVQQLAYHEVGEGWLAAALRYWLYASVVVPAMLFATTAISSRREAVLSGIVGGIAGIVPALLLHLSFSSSVRDLLASENPTYWMISTLRRPALQLAYTAVLFGSLLDVGIGFVYSIIERVDAWSVDRRGTGISLGTRAGIAMSATLVSGALSLFGIVSLVAKGYGVMAYGFLALFIGPLLTIGLVHIVRDPPKTQLPDLC